MKKESGLSRRDVAVTDHSLYIYSQHTVQLAVILLRRA